MCKTRKTSLFLYKCSKNGLGVENFVGGNIDFGKSQKHVFKGGVNLST